jgi:hypothetical protein
MARKNLNDTIHGDRATIRGGSVSYPKTATYGGDVSEGFTDRLFSKETEAKKFGSTSPNQGGSSVRDFLDSDSRWGSHKSSSVSTTSLRCYETHPALAIPNSDLQIFGGSCCSPSVKDADVYIGFDSGMRFTQKHWPWKKGAELLFKITDMDAPSDAAEFKKLIKWTREQLDKGLKVHCGCIGGHGRTGTFLAALVSEFGEPDAITYVRTNYCKKAVESSRQINFLHEHFGVTKVAGSKEGSYRQSSPVSKPRAKGPEVYTPLTTEGSIFAGPTR